MNITAPGEGLLTLIHVTTDSRISWDEWEKFESFVRHKDAAWVLDEHRARGLPETGIKENYSRYAKSLVAIGDGDGAVEFVVGVLGLVSEWVGHRHDVAGLVVDRRSRVGQALR